MARKAGRNGALYVSLDGVAAASPVLYMAKFSLNKDVAFIDVTSFGDSIKTSVAGLPDGKGSVSGFLDAGATATGTDALYNAAGDGIARGFYFYLDTSTPTVDYFYGQAFWDFSLDTAVDGPIAVQSNFQAATTITFKNA